MVPSAVDKLEKQVFLNISKDFKVVFDIGSRNDLDYYELRRDIEYHLFEPNPEYYKNLITKINEIEGPFNIVANEFGIGDRNDDEVDYYLSAQSTFVGELDSLDARGAANFKVKLVTLEEYVRRSNISRIDFIKIDTEGLDYVIIKAGLPTIDRLNVPFLQFEYWRDIARFVPLLPQYDLYLMIDPYLSSLSGKKSGLAEIDENIIDLVDNHWVKNQWGGNVLAVRKTEGITKEQIFIDYPETIEK